MVVMDTKFGHQIRRNILLSSGRFADCRFAGPECSKAPDFCITLLFNRSKCRPHTAPEDIALRACSTIRAKGAKLAVPGLVDLSDLTSSADGMAKIVLEALQELLLKIALQAAREDYETRRDRQRQGICRAKANGKYSGRAPDTAVHQRIVALRTAGQTIGATASLAGCSVSQVKRIWAMHRDAKEQE